MALYQVYSDELCHFGVKGQKSSGGSVKKPGNRVSRYLANPKNRKTIALGVGLAALGGATLAAGQMYMNKNMKAYNQTVQNLKDYNKTLDSYEKSIKKRTAVTKAKNQLLTSKVSDADLLKTIDTGQGWLSSMKISDLKKAS